MMDYERKRSGQIPKFGNWDYSNDLPITEYFECARQAGLIPPPSSSDLCPCGPCVQARRPYSNELYAGAAPGATEFRRVPLRVGAVPTTKKLPTGNEGRNKNRRPPQDKEQRNQVRVGNDVKHQHPRNQILSMKQQLSRQQPPAPAPAPPPPPHLNDNAKPIDEDLYQIPSHLLQNSKRKKMLGFFSRCLVPPCRA